MRGTFSGIEAPVHVILPRARRSPEQLLLVLLSLSLSLSRSLPSIPPANDSRQIPHIESYTGMVGDSGIGAVPSPTE